MLKLIRRIKGWLFPVKVRLNLRERKKMLKGISKNELIRMIIQNELVIARIIDEYKIKDISRFK